MAKAIPIHVDLRSGTTGSSRGVFRENSSPRVGGRGNNYASVRRPVAHVFGSVSIVSIVAVAVVAVAVDVCPQLTS